MRGEDKIADLQTERDTGSPPHARGRRHPRLVVERQQRITPACAGKTPTRREMDLTVTDHPRMRGEDDR